MALSPVSGRLVASRGPRLPIVVAGAIIAAGAAGFVPASHAAWGVVVGCGVMIVLLGLLSTGRWAYATAERNGARLAAEPVTGQEEAR